MTFQAAAGLRPRLSSEDSYEIWIGDTNGEGIARHPSVVSAARGITSFFLAYRRSELGCPSLANSLADEAVDQVCGVLSRTRIEDYKAYLKSAFRHLVDRHLSREKRLVSIESTDGSDWPRPVLTSETEAASLERRILIAEVLDAMDEQTRAIFAGRRAGYTGEEIAKRLGITTGALYTNYCRGLAMVVEKFGLTASKSEEKKNVNGGEPRRKRRSERRSDVSTADHQGPRELSNTGHLAASRR